jgi:hypothetical protein
MPDKETSKRVLRELLANDGRELVEIAKQLDISKQRLSNYKDGNRFPDADFIQKWQKTFGQNIMDLMEEAENKSTGKSTNVSRETRNLTSVHKITDNKDLMIRGHVYTDLIEKNSDYKILPTVILTDYKIVPNNILESHEREIQRQDGLIVKYERLIERLEKENATLRSQVVTKQT